MKSSCFLLICWLVSILGAFAGSPATGRAQETSETQGDSDLGKPERVGFVVEVPLPLVGDRDEEVRRKVLEIAGSQSQRPVVVLRFAASPLEELTGEPDHGGMQTRGSQFERCLALARFLSGREASNAYLIAYLSDRVEGHAVLPVLACEEILSAPGAELGNAAIDDEVVDATIESAYRDIVRRRATLPESVVNAMLDRRAEVYKFELANGKTTYVGREEADEIRQAGKFLEEAIIWRGGSLASFTGLKMRNERWIGPTVDDISQLPKALGLSTSLRTVKQLPRDWRGVSLTIRGELQQSRVNQIIRAVNTAIQENEVNLLVLQIKDASCKFQPASQFANFLTDLQSQEIYTLGLVETSLTGPIGLVPAACREAVLIESATLGPDAILQTSVEENNTTQRFLDNLATEANRPVSLLSVLLDHDVRVQEYVNATTGDRAVLADWQRSQRADSNSWVANREIAGGDSIDQSIALQYRLVDSADPSTSVALGRLGVEAMPPELQTPWLDASLDMLLSQSWLPRLLLTIGFFALMAELGSPGLGAGGFLSAMCFLGFFWVEGLNGNVEWLEILLFVAGLVALAIELFVVPGFGVFGIGGLLMLFVSVVLASQTFILPGNSAQLNEVASNLFWTACLALAGMIGLLFMHKQLERLPMFKFVTLQPEEDLADLDYRESVTHREHLLGQQGLTTTRLNPSGKAQFGRDIIPVVGSGNMIDEGVPIYVVEVRGNLVIVEQDPSLPNL